MNMIVDVKFLLDMLTGTKMNVFFINMNIKMKLNFFSHNKLKFST